MFRLNRLTDYAVVVLMQMAQTPARRVSASQLSDESGLPLPTVSKLLNTLARGGLIASTRGATGGYALTQDASQITVASVIQALEGPIALTACVEGAHDSCESEGICPMRGNWEKVNTAIRTALDGVTLADMTAGFADFGGGPVLETAPPALEKGLEPVR